VLAVFLKLGNIQYMRAWFVYQNSCRFPLLVYLCVFVFHEIVRAASVLVCICLWGFMSFTPLARQCPRGNGGLAV